VIDFTGKVLMLTGAASGIGAAVATLFHAHGASVVLTDRQADALAALASRLGSADRVLTLPLDVTVPGDVDAALDQAARRVGGIDHRVPAAGIFRPAPIAAMSDAQWRETMAVNLDGVFHTCRAAVPHLRDGGAIVNIASVAGHRGSVSYTHYSATKGAVLAFTRALAQELAPRLRINAVSPGIIATPMTDHLVRERGERLVVNTPMGRTGTAHEVAGVIAFLCSDLASFITGETIHINGGLYIGS
jgi:3-oxoacyl-[acyl-carrier protein] reductase